MYTINNWTLQINDLEMRQLFYQANFKRVCWAAFAISLLRAAINIAFYTLNHLIIDADPSSMINSYIQVSSSIGTQIILSILLPFVLKKKLVLIQYALPILVFLQYIVLNPIAGIPFQLYIYAQKIQKLLNLFQNNKLSEHVVYSSDYKQSELACYIHFIPFRFLIFNDCLFANTYFYQQRYLLESYVFNTNQHNPYCLHPLSISHRQIEKIEFLIESSFVQGKTTCQTYFMQQKDNLLEILGFFPESLMIVKDTPQGEKEILYQNVQMRDFQKTAELISLKQEQTPLKDKRYSKQGNFENINTSESFLHTNLWSQLLNKTINYERIQVPDNNDNNQDEQNQQSRHYEFKQKEVTFDQQTCRFVLLRDITELVRSEYIKSVEKLSEIMIASTSHDMRTPLNAIITMLKLIKSNPNDNSLQKWIRIAINSSSLLQFLVNDTLDYFQIKSGKFSKQEKEFNLKEMAEEAFELISFQMESKKLTKEIQIDECLEHDILIGDKQRISQVLVNLLSNSIKFTFKGFIKIKITKIADLLEPLYSSFSINNQRRENQSIIENQHIMRLQISVQDSGIGIKEEEISKLFKMFEKIPSSAQLNTSGIGLGLTICNKILNEFGSELQLKSEFQKGSEFFFVIDIATQNTYSGFMMKDDNDTFKSLRSESQIIQTNERKLETLPIKTTPFAYQDFDNDKYFNLDNSDNEEANPCQTSRRLIIRNLFRVERNESNVSLARPQSNNDIDFYILRGIKNCDCAKILIVDDNIFNIFSLKTLIEMKFNLSCEEAYHGQDACQIVERKLNDSNICPQCKNQYALIFMDISMPIMDGYEATSMIREIEASKKISNYTPIIALSAHATEAYKSKASVVGMDFFCNYNSFHQFIIVTKPIEFDQLLDVLGKMNLL